MTATRPELVLIRHGETEWSVARRHTGRTDIALTARGRAQARAIADSVADIEFSRVIASPLQRAWDTATLAGLAPVRDDDIVEWDYGDFEGITTADVRSSIPDWSVWTHPITGGESVDEVGTRADAAIQRCEAVGGTIGIVAHAHFLRILAARWLELDAREGRRFVLDTATLSVLSWERENRVVLRWNDPCGRASVEPA